MHIRRKNEYKKLKAVYKELRDLLLLSGRNTRDKKPQKTTEAANTKIS